MKVKRHDLSRLFGDMPGDEWSRLGHSIKRDGLQHPITLWQGKILDGWHRYQACLKAGVEPRFVEFDGDDREALGFVMRENAYRRHLTDAMKVSITKQVLDWHKDRATEGRPKNPIPGIELSQEVKAEDVAKAAQVSVATVHRHTAIEKTSPRLLAMVEQGQVGLKTAEQATRVVSGDVLERASPEQIKALSQAMGQRLEARCRRLEQAAKTFREEWDFLVRLDPMSDDVAGALSAARHELSLCLKR